MADRETMTGHRRIEAAELNRIEIIDGGRRLCLSVRDAAGRPASMSLPIECLNAVVTAVPRSDRDLLADAARSVHRLDSWTLRDEGAGLVLTLHLPDGARIAFGVKPSQIAAIASFAGCSSVPNRDLLN